MMSFKSKQGRPLFLLLPRAGLGEKVGMRGTFSAKTVESETFAESPPHPETRALLEFPTSSPAKRGRGGTSSPGRPSPKSIPLQTT